VSANITAQLEPLAIPIKKLNFDPANARKHGAKNLSAIKASLNRYGQRKPIVVKKQGMVVEAGNGTLEAAKALGWDKIAAVVIDDDPATATGYAIADNRTGELAEWDDECLASLLQSLEDEIPLTDLGFSDDDLAELLGADPEEPAEDPGAEEPPAEPVSQRGEVYALGPHRLMCGDSTSAEDVAALLGGDTPNLMVTDPPYGVSYDPNWRVDAAAKGALAYAGTRNKIVTNDDRADWSEAWALFPGAVAYVWHDAKAQEVQESLKQCGFEARAQIVWAKPRFAIGRGHYHWQHEPCWYAVRKGKTAAWAGDRSQTTLWAIPLDVNVEGGHSTQKPLECMERPIRNHEGDVYDPFLGSGTTLIAAARQGRRCYGLEISPAYCDVIRKRWGNYARAANTDPGPDAL